MKDSDAEQVPRSGAPVLWDAELNKLLGLNIDKNEESNLSLLKVLHPSSSEDTPKSQDAAFAEESNLDNTSIPNFTGSVSFKDTVGAANYYGEVSDRNKSVDNAGKNFGFRNNKDDMKDIKGDRNLKVSSRVTNREDGSMSVAPAAVNLSASNKSIKVVGMNTKKQLNRESDEVSTNNKINTNINSRINVFPSISPANYAESFVEADILKRRITNEVEAIELSCKRRIANAESEIKGEREAWRIALQKLEEENFNIRQFYEGELKSLRRSTAERDASLEKEKQRSFNDNKKLMEKLIEEERQIHQRAVENIEKLHNKEISMMKQSNETYRMMESGKAARHLDVPELRESVDQTLKTVELIITTWREDAAYIRYELAVQSDFRENVLKIFEKLVGAAASCNTQLEDLKSTCKRMSTQSDVCVEKWSQADRSSKRDSSEINRLKSMLQTIEQKQSSTFPEMLRHMEDIKEKHNQLYQTKELHLQRCEEDLKCKEEMMKETRNQIRQREDALNKSEINQMNAVESNQKYIQTEQERITRLQQELQQQQKVFTKEWESIKCEKHRISKEKAEASSQQEKLMLVAKETEKKLQHIEMLYNRMQKTEQQIAHFSPLLGSTDLLDKLNMKRSNPNEDPSNMCFMHSSDKPHTSESLIASRLCYPNNFYVGSTQTSTCGKPSFCCNTSMEVLNTEETCFKNVSFLSPTLLHEKEAMTHKASELEEQWRAVHTMNEEVGPALQELKQSLSKVYPTYNT